jgi:hypothetical protein
VPAKRRSMPWEPLALLRAVREVAALADRAAPQAVTQVAFDAARPTAGPYSGVPRAKRITEQLGLRKWSRVLAVAHEPEEKHAQLLGWKTKDEEQNWLTKAYVANLLKLVAHRRGADSLTLQDYDEERVKLVAEDHKRWPHGRSSSCRSRGRLSRHSDHGNGAPAPNQLTQHGGWTAVRKLAQDERTDSQF